MHDMIVVRYSFFQVKKPWNIDKGVAENPDMPVSVKQEFSYASPFSVLVVKIIFISFGGLYHTRFISTRVFQKC